MRDIKIKTGDAAPDFTLKNQNDKEINLSSLKGKKVLLSFHPLAWTSVCEIQMKTLEIKRKIFEESNTVALGVSVDSVPCKKAWAKHMEIINTDLVSDFWPHGDVAKKYDLFIEKAGISGRANILINEQGKIELVKVYEISEIPDIEEIVKVILKK